MRQATRTFLFSFVPFALLLAVSFWAVQSLVASAARSGFRETLRDTQELLARLHARSEQATRRSLQVLAENPALKAGLQLALVESASAEARRTVADQLREINGGLGFDLLLVMGPGGGLVAGVRRGGAPIDTGVEIEERVGPGLGRIAGEWCRLTMIPVNLGEENLGALIVGERLDLAEFPIPVALEHHGRVIASSLQGVGLEALHRALRKCSAAGDCDVELNGITYFSLPLETPEFGEGFRLRGLADVDAATAPVLGILRRVFAAAGLAAMLAALVLNLLASRSVTRPLSELIAHLRTAEATGELAEFLPSSCRVRELRQMAESFNRAAAAVREGRERLRRAYLEFIGSMVSALDARDPYTAGHSHRVSQWSARVAETMGFEAREVETIRIGALLHDIGKIGVPDSVLRKPGPLTREERQLIEAHPVIGRRILAEVGGFEPYLDIVELHHENWDGSGYPHGLAGEQIPPAARIVHVVDAYDAMTSDRPYRRGMHQAEALGILERFSGSQFDPAIVACFGRIVAQDSQEEEYRAHAASLNRLLERVNEQTAALSEVVQTYEASL